MNWVELGLIVVLVLILIVAIRMEQHNKKIKQELFINTLKFKEFGLLLEETEDKLKHCDNLFVQSGKTLADIQQWRESIISAIEANKNIIRSSNSQASAHFRVREVR